MDVTLFRSTAEFFAARSPRNITDPGSQRLEDWIKTLHGFLRTADHHAITAINAPYPPAGADVYVMNPFVLKALRAADIIFEVGIASIDNGVPLLHGLRKGLNRLLRRTTRRDHDPYGPGSLQLTDQIL